MLLRIALPLTVLSAALLTGCATKSDFYLENNLGSQDASKSSSQGGSLPATWKTHGKKVFVFDPKVGEWAAYDQNGQRVSSGRASGGRDFCPDIGRGCRTPAGTYRVTSKGGADCQSSIFPIETNGGAPMPYCMKFGLKGYAVHGSYDVPNYNASHGCVRVTPADAKWLSENFMQVGTKVIIESYS